MCIDRHAGLLSLVGIGARGDRKAGVSRQPERALVFSLREAGMGGHKWRAGFETASDFSCRAPSFFGRQKMQRQETGGCIERPFRRIVDVALVQADARTKWPERSLGQVQHFGGRVDAVECPFRLRLRKCLQLEPAASPKHEHASILRGALRQQDGGHAMQVGEARHEAAWSFSVPGHGLGIGKMTEQLVGRVRTHELSPDRGNRREQQGGRESPRSASPASLRQGARAAPPPHSEMPG